MQTRLFFIKALWQQYQATRTRLFHFKQGLEVPPLLIISLTQRCNLNCAGCYSKVLHQDSGAELTASRFREILGEAGSLGISIILLAGGEPPHHAQAAGGIPGPAVAGGSAVLEKIDFRCQENHDPGGISRLHAAGQDRLGGPFDAGDRLVCGLGRTL
ncbi:MAG TPA: 4Fe-4S cluster-binding domain-containing protein, partial [Candidatus Cloacimonadota bacterium]|nr:4Fe-4S cluster-binding domain-containing protein [Candidatus Cloacimonadota bacterium]